MSDDGANRGQTPPKEGSGKGRPGANDSAGTSLGELERLADDIVDGLTARLGDGPAAAGPAPPPPAAFTESVEELNRLGDDLVDRLTVGASEPTPAAAASPPPPVAFTESVDELNRLGDELVDRLTGSGDAARAAAPPPAAYEQTVDELSRTSDDLVDRLTFDSDETPSRQEASPGPPVPVASADAGEDIEAHLDSLFSGGSPPTPEPAPAAPMPSAAPPVPSAAPPEVEESPAPAAEADVRLDEMPAEAASEPPATSASLSPPDAVSEEPESPEDWIGELADVLDGAPGSGVDRPLSPEPVRSPVSQTELVQPASEREAPARTATAAVAGAGPSTVAAEAKPRGGKRMWWIAATVLIVAGAAGAAWMLLSPGASDEAPAVSAGSWKKKTQPESDKLLLPSAAAPGSESDLMADREPKTPTRSADLEPAEPSPVKIARADAAAATAVESPPEARTTPAPTPRAEPKPEPPPKARPKTEAAASWPPPPAATTEVETAPDPVEAETPTPPPSEVATAAAATPDEAPARSTGSPSAEPLPSTAAPVVDATPQSPLPSEARPAAEPKPVAPNPLPEAESPARVEPTSRAPKLVERTEPVLPPKAKKRGLAGTVVLKLLISERGRVVRVLVEESTSPEIEAAAIDAVLRWKYEPGLENGEPARAWSRETLVLSP